MAEMLALPQHDVLVNDLVPSSKRNAPVTADLLCKLLRDVNFHGHLASVAARVGTLKTKYDQVRSDGVWKLCSGGMIYDQLYYRL